MRSSLARLVFPALRWRPRTTGFAHERRKIDAALAAGVGGFIVFGGMRDAVAELTRDLRRAAGRPLLVGSDLERGGAQQVQGLTDLPPPAALGFLDDLDVTNACGVITASEARAVGINWTFAPVCDLDLEPRNPIIGTRSFGADATTVAAHAVAWVRGCQEHGVLACAKHFPGHGRTTIDSHETLPRVPAPIDELRADVAPFADAIRAGVGSVMSAHVAYPAWATDGRAATFAPEIVGYLRDALGFGGVLVTDALIMAGATQAEAEAPATVRAVAAGCDALLYPRDFAAVVRALDAAVGEGGAIPTARADEALARCEAAAARWDRADTWAADVDLAGHAWFADAVADRSLHFLRGEAQALRPPLAVTIVDDDVGGPYVVGPRDVFEEALREAGLGAWRSGVASRIVLVYSEPRSWKGRADLGERSLRALRRVAPTAGLVILFGHPRLAAQLPGATPVLCAWHGQPLMQRAAGRKVLEFVS